MRLMMLCFSGAIGSGKTTVSTAIADGLGWPRAGFGDYVRSVALQRGVNFSRETLQQLGKDLIESLGWEQFCRAVLLRGGWVPGGAVVVDGVRHNEAIATLRGIAAPLPVLLVHLKIEDAVRQGRLVGRRDAALIRQDGVDKHSTEVQVHTNMSELADYVADADRPIQEIVASVIGWVASGQR